MARMVEDSDVIAEPSILTALAEHSALKGAVAFLVNVDPETDRTVYTARQKQVGEIDRSTDRAGVETHIA